ncbi:MAG: DUF4269 domain-containing protein [Sneathiella sp.]
MSVRYEQAEALMNAIGLYTILARYDPLFVGTLPIDVDIPGSDIDIICKVEEPPAFIQLLEENYGDQRDFEIHPPTVEMPYIVCRFTCLSFEIEIFGQDMPVKDQNAWRHMEAERKLLSIGGEAAREKIRALKRSGLKTEPAFAEYFKIDGDPYEVLLEISDMTLSEILSAYG